MRYDHHIFDVGAFNGLDGIALALQNQKVMIHAFEANPSMIKIIKSNKKKIEDFLGKKILNFKVNNYAVSDKNAFLKLNIALNPTVSSLHKFSKEINKTWPGYSELHFKYIKQVKVKAITLKKYCEKNGVKKINYLHIDTQGNDLKVLKGLKDYIYIVEKGVLEAAVNKKKALYQNSNTINQIKKFLKSNKYIITKIDSLDENIKNEKNIFFEKKNFVEKYNIKTNYNLRFYNRIVSGKINIKDIILNFIKRLL
tara:strand:- start:1705 stop:2466 length:762 start_codon:yes stop_codon:yes gene_type:complete